MLRYYEQIGLLESLRKDDYAYRVYDEVAIKRLQQIIILRKLQIPVRQIKDILNNQDAVAVIEVFKQNIAELDEKITALSTLKSILARFVDEMQEKADVRLKLDLLNDTAMLAVVNALSFSENKIEEKVSMEELNKASEMLDKENEKNVRIVYRPPSTVACLEIGDCKNPPEKKRQRKFLEEMAKNLIKETDLFKRKPDMRVFGFDAGDEMDTMWVNIPDDLEIPAPWKKIWYTGGLYAACKTPDSSYEWVEKSDEYEWDVNQGPGGLEYFNPFNIYGFENTDSEMAMYIDDMCPIKEIGKLSDEQKKAINAAMAELDKSASRGKPVVIDLSTMVLQKNDGHVYELCYPGEMITLKVENMFNPVKLLTARSFSLPLKIDLRAKTDKDSIKVGCAKIDVSFKWSGYSDGKDSLCIYDMTDGRLDNHKKSAGVPVNEFVDIECFFTKDCVAIRVNGELRHYGDDYNYVRKFTENPDYNMIGEVYVGTENGSTITVESLRVTEI